MEQDPVKLMSGFQGSRLGIVYSLQSTSVCVSELWEETGENL